MQKLDEFIDRVKTLPPAPRILVQLLVLLQQDNVDTDRIVKLITFDPVLTAKVLQRCNSAAIGLAQRVRDIAHAVIIVGNSEIYRLAASAAAETTLGEAQRGYGIGTGGLWQHSVVASVGARLLALRVGGDENLAFTAALLHDIGKLVLSTALEEQYGIVEVATTESEQSLIEIEKILLGVEHSEIGGRLLQRWSFPPDLVEAVWHHHNPVKSVHYQELAACIHTGDAVAHALGHGYQKKPVEPRPEALRLLTITEEDFRQVVSQTEASLKNLKWFQQKSDPR